MYFNITKGIKAEKYKKDNVLWGLFFCDFSYTQFRKVFFTPLCKVERLNFKIRTPQMTSVDVLSYELFARPKQIIIRSFIVIVSCLIEEYSR